MARTKVARSRKPATAGENGIDISQDVMDTQPVRIQAAGQRFWAGDMRAINTTLPLSTIVRLSADQAIFRQDFELDANRPGNRPVDNAHVERIKQAMLDPENATHLMLGAAILAVDPAAIQVEPKQWPDAENGKLVDTRVFGLKTGYDMFTIDFQHRKEAIARLYEEIVGGVVAGDISKKEIERLFSKTSIPVIIVLEKDPASITHMFVSLAQAKPITPSLVVAMDRFDPANKLALTVARKWSLLNRDRKTPASGMEYLKGAPSGDKLYAAAALRSAVSTMLIGFRDRTPVQRNENLAAELRELYGKADDESLQRAADWIVKQLNYAADKLPGWKELATAKSKEEYREALDNFKRSSLLRSSGGLSVVAGCIAAARIAGLDAKRVIDELADSSRISFRREDIRNERNEDGTPSPRHRFFEGSLAKTEAVEEDGHWRTVYKSAGGTRSQYEPATRRVLEFLAKDKDLKALASKSVLGRLGLESEGGRGRPRKSFAPKQEALAL